VEVVYCGPIPDNIMIIEIFDIRNLEFSLSSILILRFRPFVETFMAGMKKWIKLSKIAVRNTKVSGLTPTSLCSTFVTKGKVKVLLVVLAHTFNLYRGADKSLTRPGRKEATATEDFDVHISYVE